MSGYKSKLKKSKVGTIDDGTGIEHTTDRGLYRTEIEGMLNASFDSLPSSPTLGQVEKAERDHLLITLLWETWARPDELLSADVEELDLKNRILYLRMTKRKVRRQKNGELRAQREERETSFSEETGRKLIRYLKGRKTGPIFTGNKGRRLTKRALVKMVHKYALRKGLQKIVGYDAQGRGRFLISPKAFREAGEAYAVMEGMDRDMAAQRAGHTKDVQERNYTKYDAIRARDLVDRHRPRMKCV